MSYPEEFKDGVMQVLNHEGGYVNDPQDPGGETKFGISKRAYPNVDIKNLSRKQAIKIYYDDYWIKTGVVFLPKKLRQIYFDMTVNMGRSRATKILQETCNNKNKQQIAVDGKLGKMTAKASEFVEPERLKSFRVKYYADLVNRKPTLKKYWFGWYRRAVSH